MRDIDHFCDICADEGVEEALRVLPPGASLRVLIQACSSRARHTERSGDRTRAERLYFGVQYLTYLDQPYPND